MALIRHKQRAITAVSRRRGRSWVNPSKGGTAARQYYQFSAGAAVTDGAINFGDPLDEWEFQVSFYMNGMNGGEAIVASDDGNFAVTVRQSGDIRVTVGGTGRNQSLLLPVPDKNYRLTLTSADATLNFTALLENLTDETSASDGPDAAGALTVNSPWNFGTDVGDNNNFSGAIYDMKLTKAGTVAYEWAIDGGSSTVFTATTGGVDATFSTTIIGNSRWVSSLDDIVPDYYVSNTSGSDSNDGRSPTEAFLTTTPVNALTSANIKPGSFISFENGDTFSLDGTTTVTLALDSSVQGTPSRWVEVNGYSVGTSPSSVLPVIDVSTFSPGTSGFGIIINELDYFRLRGVVVFDAGHTTVQWNCGGTDAVHLEAIDCTFDTNNNATANQITQVNGRSQIEFIDCTFKNIDVDAEEGISIHDDSGSAFDPNITLTNCTFDACHYPFASTCDGAVAGTVVMNGGTIQNCNYAGSYAGNDESNGATRINAVYNRVRIIGNNITTWASGNKGGCAIEGNIDTNYCTFDKSSAVLTTDEIFFPGGTNTQTHNNPSIYGGAGSAQGRIRSRSTSTLTINNMNCENIRDIVQDGGTSLTMNTCILDGATETGSPTNNDERAGPTNFTNVATNDWSLTAGDGGQGNGTDVGFTGQQDYAGNTIQSPPNVGADDDRPG